MTTCSPCSAKTHSSHTGAHQPRRGVEVGVPGDVWGLRTLPQLTRRRSGSAAEPQVSRGSEMSLGLHRCNTVVSPSQCGQREELHEQVVLADHDRLSPRSRIVVATDTADKHCDTNLLTRFTDKGSSKTSETCGQIRRWDPLSRNPDRGRNVQSSFVQPGRVHRAHSEWAAAADRHSNSSLQAAVRPSSTAWHLEFLRDYFSTS